MKTENLIRLGIIARNQWQISDDVVIMMLPPEHKNSSIYLAIPPPLEFSEELIDKPIQEVELTLREVCGFSSGDLITANMAYSPELNLLIVQDKET